jgi:hypothetical protein
MSVLGTRVRLVDGRTGTVRAWAFRPASGEDIWLVVADDGTMSACVVASAATVLDDVEAIAGTDVRCDTCEGRGWVFSAIEFDSTRAWVESCDSCSHRTLSDADAALLVAAALDRPSAMAAPDGCDHQHPYLVGVTHDEAIAWLRRHSHSPAQTSRPCASPHHLSLPPVMLDPARARTWLDAPCEHEDGTNATYCGIYPDEEPGFGWESEDFLARVDDLVGNASSAGLFGEAVELEVYACADHSGITDGALIVVSVEADDRPRLRLASYFQDHRDLAWDTNDRGVDAAVGVLRAVAAIATDALDSTQVAMSALTVPAAMR